MSENKDARVLIVDDTLQNIKVLGTILRKQGYQLNIAQNGLQALKQVEKVLPDLILLDIMMPEMDGYETCERLKADEKTRDIPIIFLTAKVESEDVVKGFELGAVDYVTKPFNAMELLRRVDAHLSLYLLQKGLEQRVEERTEELRQSNAKLQEEHEELLQAERQLAQAQKLEALGQLAGGVGHELNSPLQFVGSNTEFLQDVFNELLKALEHYEKLLEHGKSGTLTPEITEEIATAIEEADLSYLMQEIPRALEKSREGIARVGKIVRAMKNLAQPAGEEKVMVDLNEIVESATVVSHNEWKDVAELELDFDHALPQLPCLPGEFTQVVVSLLLNAAQAMGGNGKGRIAVGTRLDGSWAEVRVADTGSGIPEEVRGKIFDPFFTTKEVGQGTGQGLTTTRDVVVNKLGGEISFETEVGEGTTFLIRLPLGETN